MDYNFALIDKRLGVNKKLNEKTTITDKNLLVVKITYKVFRKTLIPECNLRMNLLRAKIIQNLIHAFSHCMTGLYANVFQDFPALHTVR